MVERIAHRGGDGTDKWTHGHVGLGQQLYCTTPESNHTSLPLESPNGSQAVLVADARIDNRRELIDALDPAAGDPVTDEALIAAAYQRWGPDCPTRLVGAFSFAIWDSQQERLFCARDHMGIRPLYFSTSEQRFAFASEPKSIHTLRGVSKTPSERRIAEYLAGAFDVGRRTFYRGIERLPPGSAVVVTDTGVDVHRYWGPDPTAELRLGSDEAYERRFRELFFEAVRCRLRGVGPVGSFLSGGIDSSSIASVGATLHREQPSLGPLHTFSAIFEEVPACDEREYIDPVLETGEFIPHYVAGDQISPLLDIDNHLWHQDGLFYPSLFMLIWKLLHEVHSAGLTIVLNGYGGDQTLCNEIRGYPRELLRSLRPMSLTRTMRQYRRRYPEITYRSLIRNELIVPQIPESVRRLRHALIAPEQYLDRTPFPVAPEFARSTDLFGQLRADAVSRPPLTHRGVHHRALTSGEPSFNLEVSNMAAAAAGVEMRFPYFDKRLVEFCLALPPEQKIRDGLGRSLARRALANVLPRKVRRRDTKTDFTENVVQSVRRYELDRIGETLFEDEQHVSRYAEMESLEQSYERMQRGGNWPDARTLLMATVLERWLDL